MHRTLALLGLLALAGIPLAASADQPLSLILGPSGLQTRMLPAYRGSEPVAIDVEATAFAIDAATAIATSTDGVVTRVPLSAAPSGRFTGALALAGTGPWNVALQTTRQGLSATSAPLTLDVADPSRDSLPILLLAGGTTAVIGGIAIVVGRPRRPRPQLT